MRAVLALILFGMLSLGAAQDTTTDSFNDKINSIDPKPSVRLDPYIRKALLKALSELEQSDKYEEEQSDYSTPNAELLRTVGDKIEGQTEAITPAKEGIQIHSFVVNGQAAFENLTANATPTFIDNKISILSTTAGNVENQVTATLPTQTPFKEIFQTRESGINVQQVRSIPVTSNSNIENNITLKETTLAPTTKVSNNTTTTTTTTTTPRPTHNDDGENIEEVEKGGVQVFQAPLVAAFTVHQDAQGLPKKVVPIYQQIHNNPKNVEKPLQTQSLPSVLPTAQQPPFRQAIPIPTVSSNIVQPDVITRQLALQKQLEEKQRMLEEQLHLLQQQQRQQEELLRRQQFLFQQKQQENQRLQQQFIFNQDQHEQFKRQQVLNEQQRFQNNQISNFKPIPVPQKPAVNPFQPPLQNTIRPQSNAQVSIQQSIAIPLDQNQNIPVNNQQQLPNREAVDFLLSLRTQQPEQFPLQENHIPQGITNFLLPGPGPISNFNQNQNFNQVRSIDDQFRQQRQSNRVFRQENGVGNFVFNHPSQNFNNFQQNRFNGFPQQPIQANKFFSVNRQNQFNSDNNELSHLLFQQGLNGRNHEDLNIVTKVLSLNHGIPLNNNVSNRLPFDSRRQIRGQ